MTQLKGTREARRVNEAETNTFRSHFLITIILRFWTATATIVQHGGPTERRKPGDFRQLVHLRATQSEPVEADCRSDHISITVLHDLSQLLNTGLSREQLRACVQLIESGVNAEAVAVSSVWMIALGGEPQSCSHSGVHFLIWTIRRLSRIFARKQPNASAI